MQTTLANDAFAAFLKKPLADVCEKDLPGLIGDALDETPDTVYALARRLRQERPDLDAAVVECLDEISPLFMDAPGKLGRDASFWEINHGYRAKRQAALVSARDSIGGKLMGAQLQREINDDFQYAVLTGDASEPGRFRATFYDRRGFFSHSTHDTLEQALEDVVGLGYRAKAKISLSELSKTEEWAEGTLHALRIKAGLWPGTKEWDAYFVAA